MRAYLSTGAGHADDGSRYVCGLNVESAMAEARAILAETEPEDAYSAHYPIRKAPAMLAVGQGALAEALAGFIGAEV